MFWIVWAGLVWIWFGFFQEWNFSPKPQIISPISIPGMKTQHTEPNLHNLTYTTFDGRRSLMETTFDGRRILMEDNL